MFSVVSASGAVIFEGTRAECYAFIDGLAKLFLDLKNTQLSALRVEAPSDLAVPSCSSCLFFDVLNRVCVYGLSGSSGDVCGNFVSVRDCDDSSLGV